MSNNDFIIDNGILIDYISIPNSAAKIEDRAFFNCCENLTIYAPANSYAKRYAKKTRFISLKQTNKFHVGSQEHSFQ